MPAMMARKIGTFDPTTFIGSFALYCIFYGISFSLPWPAFTAPIYSTLRESALSEQQWGVVMFALGGLLAASLFVRRLPFRAAVAGLSGVVWLFVGVHMMAGGFVAGFFSATGAYSIAGAVGCFLALPQWVGQERGTSGNA